eukprot:TRINITY_DN5131_c0_g1_i1.p1 TRINITY_DN5131_c0_g1~~TRINITY_DN5131_c0_g1_i1.p1  ORF type:complete len:201 (+),score=16.27 TRINITY_DN5131_c0_g1_i1:161-763(+)
MPGEEEEGLAYEGLPLAALDHRLLCDSPDMTLIYRASIALSGDEEEDISVSRGFDATAIATAFETGIAETGFGDSEEDPAPHPFEAPTDTPDSSLPEPLVVGTEDAFFFAACVAEEAARGCAAVARGVVAAVLSAAGNATRESIAAAVFANRTGAPLVSHDVGSALAHVFRAWDIFAVMRAGYRPPIRGPRRYPARVPGR